MDISQFICTAASAGALFNTSPPLHANGSVFISASSLPPLVFSLWEELLLQVLRENISKKATATYLLASSGKILHFMFENLLLLFKTECREKNIILCQIESKKTVSVF